MIPAAPGGFQALYIVVVFGPRVTFVVQVTANGDHADVVADGPVDVEELLRIGRDEGLDTRRTLIAAARELLEAIGRGDAPHVGKVEGLNARALDAAIRSSSDEPLPCLLMACQTAYQLKYGRMPAFHVHADDAAYEVSVASRGPAAGGPMGEA